MTEIDYAELDPGIRDVVRLLQVWGFETTDSGDGVTKPAAGWPEHELIPGAHVAMRVKASELVSEAERLADMLDDVLGVKVQAIGMGSPHIEASFDPAVPGLGILILLGFDDGALRSAVVARVQQAQNDG